MVIPLSGGDATNPYTSDNTVGFAFEFHLTNVIGVASANFLGACVNYERAH
jgi:hypothetical protein